MSRIVLAQDGRVKSLLGTFEPLSELPSQLRWEVWDRLPPWKRRSRAAGLVAADRLARLDDETDPEVVLALAHGLAPQLVIKATASRSLTIRTLAHLGSLEGSELEDTVRCLLERRATRLILEEYLHLVLSQEALERLWCDLARRFSLKSVARLPDNPDDLNEARRDVLIDRLSSCHSDSRLARAVALKIMQYHPPHDPKQAVSRTSRLGVAHEMFSKWARIELPAHLPEPTLRGQKRSEYETQRVLHLMTEACVSSWLEHSADVAGLDEASLERVLLDANHCARRAGSNPAFPRRLWFMVLAFSDTSEAVDWWESHADIDPRELAAVLYSVSHNGLRRFRSGSEAPNPVTPERVNALLSRTDPSILAEAFSVLDRKDRALVADEIAWIGENRPELLGNLDAQSFQRFIDRRTALALVGWLKNSLTTMQDWETFEAVCDANQGLSIAEALEIVTELRKTL